MNKLRQYEANKTADDIDLAFVLYCDISGTCTANMDTAVANKLRLIDPTNGTTDIDLTNTGLGYNYWSGLFRAIEALSKNAAGQGWRVEPHAIRMDDLVYSSNTKILAKATTAANGVSGLEFYWDTSRVTFRRGCVGMGYFSTMANNIDPLPFDSRGMDAYSLGQKNVQSGKSVATARPGQAIRPALAARIRSITGVGTYGSGAASFRACRLRRYSDGPMYTIKAAGASTVSATVNNDDWGAEGFSGGAGERLMYELYNDTTALTSSTLSALGEILQAQG